MGILDLLAPARCGACGRTGSSPCAGCIAAMRPAPPARKPPAGLDRCRAAIVYDGPARRLVAGLKYRNGRAALPWMVEALAPLADATPDVVTWIPAAPDHRRRRGFDQGQLLARALGRRLGVPARPLLRRLPGPAQTGRSLSARRAEGPRLAPRPGCRLDGLAVLVVDDVWTTGSSLSAAAAVLRRAGARRITAATIARTLLKGPLRDTEGSGDGNGEPLPPDR